MHAQVERGLDLEFLGWCWLHGEGRRAEGGREVAVARPTRPRLAEVEAHNDGLRYLKHQTGHDVGCKR